MTTISRHFQNIRHLQNHFDYIVSHPDISEFPDADEGFFIKNFSTNATYNQFLNVLRLPEAVEISYYLFVI